MEDFLLSHIRLLILPQAGKEYIIIFITTYALLE
jgi:hypothetical protein